MLVEKLVASSSVEALDAAVLHRLTGIDEVQLDVALRIVMTRIDLPLAPRCCPATGGDRVIFSIKRVDCEAGEFTCTMAKSRARNARRT